MKTVITLLFLTIYIIANSQTVQIRKDWLKKNYEENIEEISDTNRIIIRLNWYRSFHPFTIIRIENFPEILGDSTRQIIHADQFIISKVYRDDVNNYESSRPFLFEQHNTKISDEELRRLMDVINKNDFWNQKSDLILQTDGSNWELEMYIKGKYHMVSSNKVNPLIKNIGLEMIKLSGLKLKQEEIY